MTESQKLLELLKELITSVVKEIGILEGRLTASERNMETLEERHAQRLHNLQQEMHDTQQQTNKALARLEGRTIGSVKTLAFIVTVSSGVAGFIAAVVTVFHQIGLF